MDVPCLQPSWPHPCHWDMMRRGRESDVDESARYLLTITQTLASQSDPHPWPAWMCGVAFITIDGWTTSAVLDSVLDHVLLDHVLDHILDHVPKIIFWILSYWTMSWIMSPDNFLDHVLVQVMYHVPWIMSCSISYCIMTWIMP